MSIRKNILSHRYWTQEEETFLLDHYEPKGPEWCVQALAATGYPRTKSGIESKAHKLGLYYQGPPIGRFKPGHPAPNKGKKISSEQYETLRPTMFKKGVATNHLPVGTEVVRADGYWYKKVAEPNKWTQKHRLIWEQKHGPIPPGHIVTFKDGNPHNIRFDNLELITKKENVRRNRWGSGPSQYSLISGRAAKIRLKKRGIGAKTIRANPELLELSKAETLLKLKTRTQHATHTEK